MNDSLDTKNLERRAWTSYYQDGLWDIYLGLLLFILAVMSSAIGGTTAVRLSLYLVLMGGAYLLFWAGRRWITLPRLGRVKFGAERRRKKTRLTLVMSAFVLLNVLLIGLTVAANNDPDTWGRLMPRGLALQLFIAVFVGSVMAVIAYFNDLARGYYFAVVFALTFAAVEMLDNPALFWVGGALVLIPGLVLLMRFLQQHPLPPGEVMHDQRGS